MTKRRFNIVPLLIYLLMALLALLCLLPVVHLVAKSFSGYNAVIAGKVAFIPKDFQLDVYSYVLHNRLFWRAFLNSVIITIGGTFISVLVTVLSAYPLSRSDFRGKKVIMLLYVFSMLFYGGTIPVYILMQSLNLLNTLWAVIIPFLVIQFNLFIMKTGFEVVPSALEESARIDGAGHFTIFSRIYLPLAMPTVATISLLYGVNYWNNYYHSMLFITKQSVKPLQLYLYELITSASTLSSENAFENAMNLPSAGMQAAAITLSMIPVVIFYLVCQRYLISGMTIGSVKG